MRSWRQAAAAVGLAGILLATLATGCGSGSEDPEPEAPEAAAARAVHERGARELALLHERRERLEARASREPLSAEQLMNEAAEIARLEQDLALEMSGEPPQDEPYREPPVPRSEPGEFPQLQERDEELRADAVFDADPDSDIEMLVFAMQDESPSVREAAAEQLGDSEQDLALDALIGALRDDDDDVMMAVVDALEWRDDPRAIPALRVALEEASDPDQRERIQDAIEWLETN